MSNEFLIYTNRRKKPSRCVHKLTCKCAIDTWRQRYLSALSPSRRALFHSGRRERCAKYLTWRRNRKKACLFTQCAKWSFSSSSSIKARRRRNATRRDATRRRYRSTVSCTARIGLAVRFATFRQRCRYEGAKCARCTRGEDYERIVDLCNVRDDYRIAISTVAACRRHRQREHENDLNQLAAES